MVIPAQSSGATAGRESLSDICKTKYRTEHPLVLLRDAENSRELSQKWEIERHMLLLVSSLDLNYLLIALLYLSETLDQFITFQMASTYSLRTL